MISVKGKENLDFFDILLNMYPLLLFTREKMKRTFQNLLTVDLKNDDEDRYLSSGVSSFRATAGNASYTP